MRNEFFLFQVRLIADGQELNDKTLLRRRATSKRLVEAAVQACSVRKETVSLRWSNEGGTILRVYVEHFSQLPLLFGQSGLDPRLAIDAKVREVFSKLQSFCAAGIVSYAQLEDLTVDVPGGAEYIAAHRPSANQSSLNVPIRHADGNSSVQIISPMPQRVADDKMREVAFVPKKVGTHSAEIKVITIDGEIGRADANLRWTRSAESRGILELMLFDACQRGATLRARLWVAATYSKRLTFHLDSLGDIDLRGDSAVASVCARTRALLDVLETWTCPPSARVSQLTLPIGHQASNDSPWSHESCRDDRTDTPLLA